MMKSYEQANSSMGAEDALENVNIKPDQLRTARATLRQAELITDTLIRANQDLDYVFALIARGARALGHHSKVSAKTPEWRLP